jgi:hypothetical protein
MYRSSFATSVLIALVLAGSAPAARAEVLLEESVSADIALPTKTRTRPPRVRGPLREHAAAPVGTAPVEAVPAPVPDVPAIAETQEPPPPLPEAPMIRPEDERPLFPEAEMLAQQRPVQVRPHRYVLPVETASEEAHFAPRSYRSIRHSLARRGFSDVTRLRRRGLFYMAEATGPEGDRFRLVIDARTGTIEGLRVIWRAEAHPSRRVELDFLNP